MSNLILPRTPAFVALQPSPPQFIALDRDELSPLISCVGAGQLLGRIGSGAVLEGYYLHRREDGITAFLKVVPASHAERQLAASAVASWVARFGVRTPVPMQGFPKMIDDEHTVFAYQYIASRFAAATTSDMRNLGSSIATMHSALRQYPAAADIKQASASRTAMLHARRDAICSGLQSPGPMPQQLRELLKNETALFSLLDDAPGNQALHGDLVFGNILFPLDGGMPVILDFEDTLISYLPLALDLALALERFVLFPEPDDNKALLLGSEMLKAYRQGPDYGFLSCTLSDALRFLSVRALVTLAEMEAQGSTVALTEWEKFFDLHCHAIARTPLLTALQEEFLV